MSYYFKWNGVSSETKGIRLQEMPQIIRPEERIEHVIIPGRSGEMTLTEGEDVYESYIQTIPLIVESAANVAAAEKWLRGGGYVEFCCQPGLKQKARVINSVEFRKHSKHSNWWEASVQFYCQPLKEPESITPVEMTESGTIINNPGDVVSRPIITLSGSGGETIQIGSRVMTVLGFEDGWMIDCENEWVTDENGVPQQGVMNGQYPRINPGNNMVMFSGQATKLTVNGNWRYL